MKRYALCGAHGTGKTTILRDIADYLLDKTPIKPIFNTSNARNLFKMGIKINDKGDDFVQYVVQASHVSRFAEPDWFADRCVVDGFAYMEAAWKRKFVSQDCWNTVYTLMNVFAPLYTQIFYVPIEFEMENDGIRKVDIEYQQEIDRYMSKALKNYSNVTIVKGNRAERSEIVLKSIA
jgi:predicted ATPase